MIDIANLCDAYPYLSGFLIGCLIGWNIGKMFNLDQLSKDKLKNERSQERAD